VTDVPSAGWREVYRWVGVETCAHGENEVGGPASISWQEHSREAGGRRLPT